MEGSLPAERGVQAVPDCMAGAVKVKEPALDIARRGTRNEIIWHERDDRAPHPEPEAQLRCRRRRLGVRRLRDDPAALRGWDVRLPARARQGLSARLVSAQPLGDGPATSGIRARDSRVSSTSGSSAGSAGSSRAGWGRLALYSNVLIRKDQTTFVQEDLTRAAARLGRSSTRISSLLRAARGHARRSAVSVRAGRGEATRPARHRPNLSAGAPRAPSAWARVAPAEARGGVLREGGHQLPPSRSSASPRTSTGACGNVPPLRRVQHRLQLRLEVHARLQLPIRRGSCGTARRSSRGAR